MPRLLEKEPRGQVMERAEEFELPPHLEDTGIKGVETAVKARVKDRGRNLIQTPATQAISITLPSSQGTLVNWSKGKVSSSLTWLGVFSLRMVKKAAHFGWKIIRKGGGQNANNSD